MSTGKAGGMSGIAPELLIYGGQHLRIRLHQLICEVWQQGFVPKVWRDAEIVLIPQKGDLRNCNNWRGISLLEVAGKLFTCIIQDRLQLIAGDILPELQCGFRPGGGWVDMIYVVRQLVEKAIEHASNMHMVFVVLRKAYDSVPRAALWLVLQKLDLPPIMLGLIQSLHNDMEARIHVAGETTTTISVDNGLH